MHATCRRLSIVIAIDATDASSDRFSLRTTGHIGTHLYEAGTTDRSVTHINFRLKFDYRFFTRAPRLFGATLKHTYCAWPRRQVCVEMTIVGVVE